MIKNLLNKNWFKLFLILSLIFSFGLIFFNSLIDLYLKRHLLMTKAGVNMDHPKHLKIVNPLKLKNRQIPPINYEDLQLKGDEEIYGAWSALFDWPVTAIHSILYQMKQ